MSTAFAVRLRRVILDPLAWYLSRRELREWMNRDNLSSPINYWLYRSAMSTELNIEGRFYGGLKGLLRVAGALAYNPASRAAWASARELCAGGFRRGHRLLMHRV